MDPKTCSIIEEKRSRLMDIPIKITKKTMNDNVDIRFVKRLYNGKKMVAEK